MKIQALISLVMLNLLCSTVLSKEVATDAIPIDTQRMKEDGVNPTDGHPQCDLSSEQIVQSIKPHKEGFSVRLPDTITLLNGDVVQADDVYGVVLVGAYPFAARDSRFWHKRFSDDKYKIKNGSVDIPLAEYFEANSTANSEGERHAGTMAVRLELFESRDSSEGPDEPLGVYDTFVTVGRRADGSFVKLPSIIEGPMVNLVTSDDPHRVTISFVTDVCRGGRIVLNGDRVIEGPPPQGDPQGVWFRHEIEIDGLEPSTRYRYQVQIGPSRTTPRGFKTAPPKGHADVRFAFVGDSRAGVGGTLRNVNAVNYDSMERFSAIAFQRGIDLMLFGGDFSTGYTPSVADFRTQLRTWKQSVAGFASQRPVYAIPGNHESLIRVFDDGSKYGMGLDRWPYKTESTEAVFADEFVHPQNGPAARQDFPSYDETVYSFQYGAVKIIGFNTNYWPETDTPKDKTAGINQKTRLYGGNPEGYVMCEQVEWIKQQIEQAKVDETVKYIVLFAHEPMFPNGKHQIDAMWYSGDNGSRAHSFRDGKLKPEAKGVIEVRNELARAIAASPKVAVVINSDEHAYYRTLIGPKVPVGSEKDIDPATGRIDWPIKPVSPLADLEHRTWYMVCGGGGAPYSAALTSPWNQYWRSQTDPRAGYRYTPQEHILLFHATADGVSVRVVNAFGETIDAIENLMEKKTP
jgi:hypothetical protein